MYEEGCDHAKSETVDVVKHKDGKFVQVWNKLFKAPGRRLLLTYFRNGKDVLDITAREYLSDGEYSHIEKGDGYIHFGYQNKSLKPRVERTLSNGKILISDEIKNIFVISVFTPEFDFDNLKPKGGAMGDGRWAMGDRAIIKKHKEKGKFFISI